MSNLNYEVKVFPLPNSTSKLVGFASVIIDETLELKSFKVFSGSDGLFVKPPQRKGKDADGNDVWYDEIWFVGDDGSALKTEVYAEIVRAFNARGQTASRSGTAQAQSRANTKGATSSTTDRPLW